MEVDLIRANINEEREATMARFLHGLNSDIKDVVELQNYVELEELVHQAIKVEKQLKRKGSMKRSFSNFYQTARRTNQRRRELLHPMHLLLPLKGHKISPMRLQRKQELVILNVSNVWREVT